LNTKFKSGERVGVLIEAASVTLLDYKAPKGSVSVGAFVQVPLRNRQVIGVVWGAGVSEFEEGKLRTITKVLQVPILDQNYLNFIEKMAEYTITPLSATFFRLTRIPEIDEAKKSVKFCEASGLEPDRLTPKRQAVFRILGQRRRVKVAELLAEANVSYAVIQRLVKQGYLTIKLQEIQDKPQQLNLKNPGTKLNSEQKNAVSQITQVLDKPEYAAILLKGVPGAGKTEVYLEAIAQVLKEGKQVLVLLPEIALTNQILNRFEERFKTRPFEWHSAVSKAVKRRIWRMTAEGNSQLVVGARSALFLPFANLGLIIIDEEHDSSFKQDSGIIYHGRDMAVLRASMCQAKVLLVSATPSLETLTNARNGKYHRVDLMSRFGGSQLPEIIPIDMRGQKKISGKWLSGALVTEIAQRLEREEQSLLFLNRRGYAPLTTCSECGHQLGCHDCDTNLVEHRFIGEMICHQCGLKSQKPNECPVCHAKESFVPVGPGVERLAEEVSETFSEAKLEVISSDLIKSTSQLMETLDRISRGAVDIVIGTQIVAKGHHFPKITLVGVLDADVGLHGGDFRASEKTFQIIRQVAGRAGRAELPGIALLQTWQPDNPVIQAIISNDDEKFLDTESMEREVAGCPPFGQYIAIILSGKNGEKVEEYATNLLKMSQLLEDNQITLFGPAPAPIFRIQGRLRYRFLLQADRSMKVQRTIRHWLSSVKQPTNVRLSVDVDPVWFM